MCAGNGRIFVSLVLILTVLAVAPKASFSGGLVISGDNVGMGTNTPNWQLEVQSATGDAIHGYSPSGYGVAGISTSNYGVYGSSTSGYGVVGTSDVIGVSGYSPSGTGVYGTSTSGTGVYGSSISGYAGHFNGMVYVSGNQTVGGSVTAASFSGNGAGLTSIPGTAISNTSITVDQLANDAVTPVKIAFLKRVAIVAKSGGNYNNPATAMTNFSAWCASPSVTDPCLLNIMPGVYDVGSSPVVMQSYIDIEGSGEKTTQITGAVDGGTVEGADNAELRFLTVENTGTGEYTFAIMNSPASLSMLNVTATASGGTYTAGIYNHLHSPTMTNVTANATGGEINIGVWNEAPATMTNVTATASGNASGTASNVGVFNLNTHSVIMTNVTATATGGLGNTGVDNAFCGSVTMTNVTATGTGGTSHGVGGYASIVKINSSVIKGSTNTIDNQEGTTMFVGNTQLDGGPVSNSFSTTKCAGVFDEDYTFYASTCP